MVSSQCSSNLPDLSIDYSVTYSPLRFSSSPPPPPFRTPPSVAFLSKKESKSSSPYSSVYSFWSIYKC